MGDIIVFLIILAVFILIIRFIIVSKKNGVKCIGCPFSKQCSGKCNQINEPNDIAVSSIKIHSNIYDDMQFK